MSDEADYLGEGLLIFGIYIPLALFLIGLLFGSFLNVCIHRLPQKLSVVRPRSHCTSCGSSIRWYDNIPVLSVLILRGRCRNCGEAIRLQYIAVEIGFATWLALSFFATVSNAQPLFLPFLNLAILGFLLIGLMVMDWQTMLLPDAFTLTGIAIGLFLICTQAIFLGPNEDQVVLTKHSIHLTSPGGVVDHGNVFLTGPESLIFGRIVAICGAALLLLLVRWLYKAIRHRDGMGLGDVKLIAMIAAFLGFWPAILSLFIGTLAAALYGAVLLAQRRVGGASKLPFGSFLCVGGLVAALYGNRLIDMYIAFLR
jgi:leader peptidase (prepilin peptidase)/N-methyltransferase